MGGVEVEGIFYEGDSDIQDQVLEFYKKLYRELEYWRPTIDGLEFAYLDEAVRLSLEREFEEEILEALKEVEDQRVTKRLGLKVLLWLSSKNVRVYLKGML